MGSLLLIQQDRNSHNTQILFLSETREEKLHCTSNLVYSEKMKLSNNTKCHLTAILFAYQTKAGIIELKKNLKNALDQKTENLSRSVDSNFYLGNLVPDIDGRGCWCNFQQDTVYNGRGKPVDDIDRLCKNLINGYQCIMNDEIEQQIEDLQGLGRSIRAATDVCDPSQEHYNFGFIFNAFESTETICRNFNPNGSNCQIRACVIENHFINSLMDYLDGEPAAAQSSIPGMPALPAIPGMPVMPSLPGMPSSGGQSNWAELGQFRHLDGFDPSLEINCPVVKRNIPNAENFCCGFYPERYPYRGDPDVKKCCGSKAYDITVLQCCDESYSDVKIVCDNK